MPGKIQRSASPESVFNFAGIRKVHASAVKVIEQLVVVALMEP
jgi:hypothetical protein